MIEITTGTIEEQIIKFLQETYPVTISDIESKLRLSEKSIVRVLQKLQVKGIVQLEPLPGKTYVRLLRRDFRFIGKKRQRKFIKHQAKEKIQESKEYDGIMYN